jgi:hypothetical protein
MAFGKRHTMGEIASGDDLKDFSDQVLLNQVTIEEDEKEIANMSLLHLIKANQLRFWKLWSR